MADHYDPKLYAFGKPTTIYVDAPISVHVSENFTVNVKVADVEDLHAWQFKLKWDPTLLAIVGIAEGDFLKTSGDTQWADGPINETEGWVLAGARLIELDGVSGSGTLAHVTFHCTRPGECLLDLCQTRLFNSSPETVPWNGYGDADGDGMVDVADLAVVSLCYGTSVGEPRYNPNADFDSDGFVDFFDLLCCSLNFGHGDPSPSLVPVEIAHTATDGYCYCYTHDVAVTNVSPFKIIVCQNYSLFINVTVENQGNFTETFNVTVYANTTIVETKEITLTSGNSTTITYNWNTTDFDKGNYTIKAIADQVPGETDIVDNTFVDGWVNVVHPGDLDANGIVDIFDIVLIGISFDTRPGDDRWNPIADINNDLIVDIFDIVICGLNFGWTKP